MNLEFLFSQIQQHYSLGAVLSYEKIQEGVCTENYRIETSTGVYLLKQHRGNTIPKLDTIEKTQFFLRDNMVPAVTPVMVNNNEYHIIVDEKYYSIYPFVTGFDGQDAGPLWNKTIHMGQLLAHMHLLSKDGLPFNACDQGYFMPQAPAKLLLEMERLEEIISADKDEDGFKKEALESFALKRQLLKENPDAYLIKSEAMSERHITHGDFHTGNMFFDEEGKVSALFDFEHAGAAPRMYELVRSFMMIFNHFYEEKNWDRVIVFLKAYHEIYPFSAEHLAQAIEGFYIKNFSTLWIEKFHYVDHNFRADSLLLKHHNTIIYLRDNREVFTKKLCKMVFEN